MVYCVKCGAKNASSGERCTQCGASLEIDTYPPRRISRRRQEECFGLPGGNIIPGLIFGTMIILAGISWIVGFEFWDFFWPFIIVIFGILMVAGSLYKLQHRS